MEYHTIEYSDELHVEMSGALDAIGAVKAQELAAQIIDGETPSVRLDLTNLAFIDPSGVGFLVFLFKRLSATGRHLRVLGVQGQPARLLRQLNLDDPLNVEFLREQEPARMRLGGFEPLQEAS